MFIIILAGGFWTALCSWVFWMALLAIGAFILGWLFRTPKIDEWKHKYEQEVSNSSGFSKKYAKLEKASTSYNKDKSQLCLLYTSPSPRDKRQSRMPSSA